MDAPVRRHRGADDGVRPSVATLTEKGEKGSARGETP
jgi:hypothetical protein